MKHTKPDGEAKLYPEFAAEVYVETVDAEICSADEKLLADGKAPVMAEAFWRAASPKAWNRSMQILGYSFDFPHAYRKAARKELRKILLKTYSPARDEDLQRAVFIRLKAISHPVRERSFNDTHMRVGGCRRVASESSSSEGL